MALDIKPILDIFVPTVHEAINGFLRFALVEFNKKDLSLYFSFTLQKSENMKQKT